MADQKLEHRVKQYISLHHEGESWDFKRQWHDKEKGKDDLLHDIICMANLTQVDDGLIIIGIDEEKDYSIKDVTDDPNRKDTHELVTFLRDKPFDGGFRPLARVENLIIDGKTIDIIVVENSSNVPFYLTEKFHKLEAYHIYTRVCDSNTPVNKSADRDRVEKLWKKRFGIDKNALERFQIYLRDVEGWESVDGHQSFFYKLFPEFRIEMEYDESKNGYVYYCFSQINSRPGWYNINLKYYETVVENSVGVSLDEGSFFTAVPDPFFKEGDDYYYSYTSGTLQCDLNMFFLKKMVNTGFNARSRWEKCIPTFMSEKEKNDFYEFLKTEEIKPDKNYELYVLDKLHNGGDAKYYKHQLSRAIAITNLLKQFRRERYD